MLQYIILIYVLYIIIVSYPIVLYTCISIMSICQVFFKVTSTVSHQSLARPPLEEVGTKADDSSGASRDARAPTRALGVASMNVLH